MKNKLALFILLLLTSNLVFGYEVETHRKITIEATKASILPMRLPDFGFTTLDDLIPNDTYDFFGGCLPGFSRMQSILNVIGQGAVCEDATTGTQQLMRYTNHFYDPMHNGMGFLGIFPSSLTWGLETSDIGTQDYSYKDARNYFYQGLTLPAKADRDTNLALTFRTLGDVMHLVQDLAQPQHTRNDSHATGSSYEKYTDRSDIRSALPFGGYNSIQVASPDQFWHTADGKGLADYSNRGFVSAGTNFRGSSNNILPATNYLLPDSNGATVDSRQITDPDLLGPIGPNQPLAGEIRFIKTPVQDKYTGVTATNLRTSTFSLLDDDLNAIGASMIFSLNSFNFAEAHKLLIPRAVGYSAGLINHFFRGKIDMFSSIPGSYVIENLGAEPMTGDFALYYDALDGNRYPVPGAAWTLTIPAYSQSVDLSFTKPSSPTPKTPGEFMLVFKGGMGEEQSEVNSIGAVVAKIVKFNENYQLTDATGSAGPPLTNPSGDIESLAAALQWMDLNYPDEAPHHYYANPNSGYEQTHKPYCHYIGYIFSNPLDYDTNNVAQVWHADGCI